MLSTYTHTRTEIDSKSCRGIPIVSLVIASNGQKTRYKRLQQVHAVWFVKEIRGWHVQCIVDMILMDTYYKHTM